MSLVSQQSSLYEDPCSSSANSSIDKALCQQNSIEVDAKQQPRQQGEMASVLGHIRNEKSQQSEVELLLVQEPAQHEKPSHHSEASRNSKSSSAFGKKNQQSDIRELPSSNLKSLQDSFSINYAHKHAEFIDSIKNLVELEQLKAMVTQRQNELKKQAPPPNNPLHNQPLTQAKFDEIYQKYQKYKQYYAKELETSKKLRAELRNIYDKVRKIE